MVLHRSLAMLFSEPCISIYVCLASHVFPLVINRPFLIDLPVKNIVKIIFRSRKTNPQYSCFLPFFMHFSLLVHAYFVVFCLKHIGLRCKNQPFTLQKTAYCIVKCALL